MNTWGFGRVWTQDPAKNFVEVCLLADSSGMSTSAVVAPQSAVVAESSILPAIQHDSKIVMGDKRQELKSAEIHPSPFVDELPVSMIEEETAGEDSERV